MFCPKCGGQNVKMEPNPNFWNNTKYQLYVAVEIDGEDSEGHDFDIKEVHCLNCKHKWYDSENDWEEEK